MNTIQYIKEHGIQALTDNLGISVKKYPDHGLTVLNYSQIDSPKSHPVVVECRGLIIDDNLNIVSRGFDRFFNYGEVPEHTSFDIEEAEIFEKVDGSLIKIYHHAGVWHIATRGTAFAESECNGFGVTFRDLVLRATPDDWLSQYNDKEGNIRTVDELFQEECNFWLDTDWTYIFEFTSVENRVVTRYEGYNLTFLAARHKNGVYGDEYEERAVVSAFQCAVASRYKFDSIEHCLEIVKSLPDMKEGYVVYVGGKPVCKIKSPAYVAIHHIRGEGLNPKRIMQLVLLNEVGEYLTYFPEDESFFTGYVDALAKGLLEMKDAYADYKDIEDQKEFALAVAQYDFSAVLFKARSSGKSVMDVFHSQTEQSKMRLLAAWAGK